MMKLFEFSVTHFIFLTFWCVIAHADDSYVSYEYDIPCNATYIPKNCNYPQIAINPRALRGRSQRTIHTVVLGHRVKAPFGISPVAAQKLAHPLGEIATARASASFDTLMVLSSISTTSLEDVARAAFTKNKNAVLWMQTFIFRNRKETLSILHRAKLAGYKAIVVTVDSPILADRSCSSLALYETLRVPNLFNETYDGSRKQDDTLAFDDLAWVVKSTPLPVVAKGILSGYDALKAVETGVSAIWVSNNGGRQIESGKASINVLPEVVSALYFNYPKVEVYVDGAVRSGFDVFKALALGARMAFVGRPSVWSLAVGGEAGVTKMFNIMRKEFNETMIIAGFASPNEIREEGKFHPVVTMHDEFPGKS